jgi:hypothetical protein
VATRERLITAFLALDQGVIEPMALYWTTMAAAKNRFASKMTSPIQSFDIFRLRDKFFVIMLVTCQRKMKAYTAGLFVSFAHDLHHIPPQCLSMR